MAEREQVKKQSPERTEETVAEMPAADPQKAKDLKADLDDLLDEIDGVLEENAEEFVAQYVQKGGQ